MAKNKLFDEYERTLIKQAIEDHLSNCLGNFDKEVFSTTLICFVGSRVKNNFREDSDLDIAISYEGSMREDDLFSILMDEPLYFEGIKVDFIPFSEEKGHWIYLEEPHYILFSQEDEAVEYKEEKMKRLVKQDRFLNFTLNDLQLRNHNEQDALRIIFNSFVLGDSAMELEYKQA